MTTAAGVDGNRVVQIIAKYPANRARLGSGYLIGGGLVLTAAHVLHLASTVTVRRILGPRHLAEADAAVVWIDHDPGIDLAVLRITANAQHAAEFPADLSPANYGRVAGLVDCEAVGFPLFKHRENHSYRDSHHAIGTTTPLSSQREGALEITVPEPNDGDPRTSPWEGMSGAAVFAEGALVGIVCEHHRDEGPNRITALPVTRWYDLAEVRPAALAELIDLLGLPDAAEGLIQVWSSRGGASTRFPDSPSILEQLPRSRNGAPLVDNLPPRNVNFTGRTDLFEQLDQQIKPGAAAIVQIQAQALHGLGGVGKSQLALEYAHRRRAEYDLIWWIAAEQPAAVGDQLVALARRLGIGEQSDQSHAVQVLWDELRRRERWLLVFDNAEDPEDLRHFWPPASGKVLITSRNPGWTNLAGKLAVDVLSRAEAVEFMRRRTGRDDPAFADLAEFLGDLPLALEQAAAFLEETAVSAGQYLELVAARTRELFALNRSATTEQTIASTWTVSRARLRERQPAAEELLRLIAFLAADDIPRELPAEHPDVLPEPLQAAVRNPVAHQLAVAELRRYSLIKVTEGGLDIHRLVQATVRHSLTTDEQRRWATAALRLITAAFPMQSDDPANRPVAARLLPHALTVTDHVERLDVQRDETPRLLHAVGIYLHWNADYRQARRALERALAIREATLGLQHEVTAHSVTSLADLLRDAGDSATARRLLERALPVFERELGRGHGETAYTLTSLASILAGQRELRQARSLLERANTAYAADPGLPRKDFGYSLFTLAGVHHATGDLDQARELYEYALAVWETALGDHHPTTAYAMNGLGTVLLVQRRNASRARALFEKAFGIFESTLGRDHPITKETAFHISLLEK